MAKKPTLHKSEEMTPLAKMISGEVPAAPVTEHKTTTSGVLRRTISIDPELYKALRFYCLEKNTSVSGLLSKLASEFLEKEGVR